MTHTRPDDGLSRRGFIATGAAGLLPLVLPSSINASRGGPPPFIDHSSNAPVLAVGYWQGTESLTSNVLRSTAQACEVPSLNDLHLVDARTVSSNPALASKNAVLLSVHGMSHGAQRCSAAGLSRLRLDVGFRPFHEARAQLWEYESLHHGVHLSSPTSQIVPISADHGIELFVEAEDNRGPASARLSFGGPLTAGSYGLRRGYYFVTIGRLTATAHIDGCAVERCSDTREHAPFAPKVSSRRFWIPSNDNIVALLISIDHVDAAEESRE